MHTHDDTGDGHDMYVEIDEWVWVEFGCPGHGKGPWDGLGSMTKLKVTLDIMYGKERTSTGTGSRAFLTEEGEAGESWTLLAAVAWQGFLEATAA